MVYDSQKKVVYNEIAIVVFAILTILPYTKVYIVLRFLIILVMIFYQILFKYHFELDRNIIMVFAIWTLNLFLSAIAGLVIEKYINIGSIFHELQRLIYYLLVVLLCLNFKIKFSFTMLISKMLLTFHLSIQLLQLFKFEPINVFILNNYLLEGASPIHLSLAYEVGSNFRSGSIFMNPNVYLVYPLIFLTVYLQGILIRRNISLYLWVFLSFLSIFLTGSRTGLIVGGCILMIFYMLSKKNHIKNFFILTAVVILVLVLILMGGLEFDARIFQVSEGMKDSISIKSSLLMEYFIQSNATYVFLGSISSSLITISQDMEIAHIFTWYGAIGLVWYFFMILTLIKRNFSNYKFLITTLLCIILMLGLSASTFLNMSVFPFICLFAFCNIVET